MGLKKIYLEITNGCNLNCNFCIKNRRKVTNITLDNYKIIIGKIKNYTKEIYLHVLGEPLTHPYINEFIDYAHDNNLLVNITTNGYLIDKIIANKHIHRLNISLHSFNKKYKKDLISYLDDIFRVIDKIHEYTFVTLRLWVKDNNTKDIISYINNKYNTSINLTNNKKIKLGKNLIIDTFHEFIWPDMNNNYYNSIGTCYGLTNHIGILSDGTIIPCCLDSEGIINLGNIYNDEISDIMDKKIVKHMIKGFKENRKIHELCKHCSFLSR